MAMKNSRPNIEPMLAAPEADLRIILRALCADKDTSLRAVEHFTTLQEKSKAKKPKAKTKTKGGSTTTTGTKRKAEGTLQICITCKDAFTEEENTSTSCRCHTAEIQYDDEADVWRTHFEHDELPPGEDFDFSYLVEYPEGFFWGCCGGEGDAKGCTLARHRSNDKKSKKKWLEDSEEIPEDERSDFDEDDEEYHCETCGHAYPGRVGHVCHGSKDLYGW